MTDDAERIPVFLLKTKSLPKDGYEDYFSTGFDQMYWPTFVPVLAHTFKQQILEQLESLIGGGKLGVRYGGIIFTSQRAVEAFIGIVNNLRVQAHDFERLLPSDLPLYVVGPATARTLRASRLSCSILGEQCGNGERLASFILDHYRGTKAASSIDSNQRRPLLFLVGEQRRDVIPKTLEAADIKVDEVEIYETRVMDGFADAFRSVVESRLKSHDIQWVVVFSPTSCKDMLDTLGLLDATSGRFAEPSGISARRTFIATIGPTTRDYLSQEFGLEPDVCAQTPDPEGVGEGIRDFMKSIDIA